MNLLGRRQGLDYPSIRGGVRVRGVTSSKQRAKAGSQSERSLGMGHTTAIALGLGLLLIASTTRASRRRLLWRQSAATRLLASRGRLLAAASGVDLPRGRLRVRRLLEGTGRAERRAERLTCGPALRASRGRASLAGLAGQPGQAGRRGAACPGQGGHLASCRPAPAGPASRAFRVLGILASPGASSPRAQRAGRPCPGRGRRQGRQGAATARGGTCLAAGGRSVASGPCP
mmetsp:Transcript_71867/g.187354  ORF Transcript_71867/g.187354 Transcript_71867/m.187354 type:complete len:231 (-) Transcript_71867:227-919(-)